MMEGNVRKRMYICICMSGSLFYTVKKKLTEPCKPTIMEKIKITKKRKNKNHLK